MNMTKMCEDRLLKTTEKHSLYSGKEENDRYVKSYLNETTFIFFFFLESFRS